MRHHGIHLLVEQQSTNLTVASEEVNNWTVDSATVQQNVAISPAGTLTADRLTDDADGPRPHYVYKSTSLGVSVGSTVYTVSFYAKSSGHSELQTYDNNQNTSANLTVNLANGTITSGTGLIKSCGDGWHRISYQVTADHSTTSVVRILMKSGGSNSYLGTSYKGILIWGMQVEIGSAPTSYIKTITSATATRAADSCSVVSEQLFDNGAGALYAEASRNSLGTYNGIASVDDGSGSNIVQIFGNSVNFRAEVVSGGTTEALLITTGHLADTYHKHCVTFSSSEAKYYADGSQKGSTDTDLNIPSMSQMHLGMLNAETNGNLNGHIKRVALYNVALSDTELQALTS